MIIDCISDLHGFYPELQGGDLLIVAGDLTARDQYEQFIGFKDWLSRQDYKKIITISGNHDNLIEKRIMMGPEDTWSKGKWCYLEDSGIVFQGLKIWGSPWTKTFPGINPHCKAFTVETEEELSDKWSLIPSNVDILITHSPPFGILDKVSKKEKNVGSLDLRNRVLDGSYFTKLKLHVFGHIHEAYGTFETTLTKFVNASHVDELYQPINKPIRIIL